LEADGIDTIGGLIFNRLGSLPPEGTRIELSRLKVTIRRTSRKRIKELVLEKTTCVEEQTDTAAA
jgi:Mg2+/Co2+ transporter CorC